MYSWVCVASARRSQCSRTCILPEVRANTYMRPSVYPPTLPVRLFTHARAHPSSCMRACLSIRPPAARPPVCPPVRPAVHLPARLSVFPPTLFTRPSIQSGARQSVHPCERLSVHPPARPAVHRRPPVFLSAHPFIHSPFHLSTHPSVCPPAGLSTFEQEYYRKHLPTLTCVLMCTSARARTCPNEGMQVPHTAGEDGRQVLPQDLLAASAGKVRASLRASMRACARACVRVCGWACMWAYVYTHMDGHAGA